jgi:hypothetical protein
MDDHDSSTTVSFEWTDDPDDTAAATVLSRLAAAGDLSAIRLEVTATDLDVGELVGIDAEEGGRDDEPHLDASTKAYWAAVAIHGTGNEWTTAKELADLLAEDDGVTRNNAHAYLTTLSNNRVLETRTRETDGRGANPTEYRLGGEGATLVETLWDDAGDRPEAFRAAVAPADA